MQEPFDPHEDLIKTLENITERDEIFEKISLSKIEIQKQYPLLLNKQRFTEALSLIQHPQELLNSSFNAGQAQNDR